MEVFMSAMVLTAYDGAILGPIAKLLGWIMNGIYAAVYNVFGVESVILAITLLTIVIYMLMLPLTYQQQKFSKLNQAMQPEIQAIQAKYKNRKDQASQNMMNEETQLVYKKYGVNPMGSCVQLLIQMPILFALYRVFYNIPAYISSVKSTYDTVAQGVIGTTGYQEILTTLMTDNKITTGSGLTYTNVADKLAGAEGSALTNYVIDILYKFPSTVWENLSASFPNVTEQITSAYAHIKSFNYFLGMNISDSPWSIMKNNFSGKNYLMVVIPLLIPILAYLSQVVSIKISMASNNNSGNDQMAQQMQTMNTMMPLMSLFLCFTVPVGLGVYWILSAVIRTIQMVVINKKISNMGLDDIIAKNQAKVEKEREKQGIRQNQIRDMAAMSTRNYNTASQKKNVNTSSENEAKAQAAASKKANAKPGSMASKANLVQQYNEKNTRK